MCSPSVVVGSLCGGLEEAPEGLWGGGSSKKAEHWALKSVKKKKKKAAKPNPGSLPEICYVAWDESQLNLVVEKMGKERVGGHHGWVLGPGVLCLLLTLFFWAGEGSSSMC